MNDSQFTAGLAETN